MNVNDNNEPDITQWVEEGARGRYVGHVLERSWPHGTWRQDLQGVNDFIAHEVNRTETVEITVSIDGVNPLISIHGLGVTFYRWSLARGGQPFTRETIGLLPRDCDLRIRSRWYTKHSEGSEP